MRFRNLVVKEDEGALEDGVLGNSFLKNFRVSPRFSGHANQPGASLSAGEE